MSEPDPPTRAVSVHKRRHGRHPMATCWHCQRELARCRSKIMFTVRQDADAAVDSLNERENYESPVMRYPCDWGTKEQPHWHMAHARFTADVKRARKAERKWKARRAEENAHWYYDMPLALAADIVRTLRD